MQLLDDIQRAILRLTGELSGDNLKEKVANILFTPPKKENLPKIIQDTYFPTDRKIISDPTTLISPQEAFLKIKKRNRSGQSS